MIGRTTFALCAAVLVAACLVPNAAAAQGAQPEYAALIAANDRSAADREIDKRRDPVKLLAFWGPRTGMKVLDMGAGGGYSTELMARAVGLTGMVYGQNTPEQGARGKAAMEARLQTPAGKNIVGLWRPFDDPLPAEVSGLDLITYFFFYHDTVYMQVDRAQMNRRLFAALKPGAMMIIADHSAKPGDGITVGRTLHRIEESVLRREVEAAGFKLVGEADFLRHPEDTRDFSVQPPGPRRVDEFVLKYQKPQ